MEGPKLGVAVENSNNFNFNRNFIKANVVVIEYAFVYVLLCLFG